MRSNVRFILTVLVLSGSILFVYRMGFLGSSAGPVNDRQFPSRIGNWTGVNVDYDPKALSELSPDKIVYKSYTNGNGLPSISLFIAYYNSMGKADLSHSPIVCFTGQGWRIEQITKRGIPLVLPDVPKISVNQMIQNKLDTTMITLFWYQSVKHAYANRGIQKLSLFAEKLLGRPDNNAFVRITCVVASGKSVEEMTSYLFAFVRDMYPELEKFFL